MQYKYKCVPKRSWLQNFGPKIKTKIGGYGAKIYHKHDLGTLDPAGLVLERRIKEPLFSRPVKRWYNPQNQHFFWDTLHIEVEYMYQPLRRQKSCAS